MKFTFTKQTHTSKINVWYDGVYIGEIFTLLRERKDIDWSKYKADISLKMSPTERYETKYVPSVKIPGYLVDGLGSYSSKEEAAEKLLEHHRKCANGE